MAHKAEEQLDGSSSAPQDMFLLDLRAALPLLLPSASCSFLWNTDSSKHLPGGSVFSLGLVKLVQACVLGPPLEPLAAYLEGGKRAPIGCGPWLPDCCREPLLSPLPYPTTCLYLRLWPVLGTGPQNRSSEQARKREATGSAHACITFDEGRRVWKREGSVQRALLLSWLPHSCILTSGAATLWIDN